LVKRIATLTLSCCLAASLSFAYNHVTTISYYGPDGSGFHVTNPPLSIFRPGDTLTIRMDDPGRLILRADDGSVRWSDSGEITYTAEELSATRQLRCSMLLEDGTLLGWEATKDPIYGVGPKNPIVTWLMLLFLGH
jgi:hypothetical protein